MNLLPLGLPGTSDTSTDFERAMRSGHIRAALQRSATRRLTQHTQQRI
jgi:hypothetical protein